MIHRIISLFIGAFILFGCGNQQSSKYPVESELNGIVNPIRLAPKEITIQLNGYFKNPAKIDSFRFHPGIKYELDENNNLLQLKIDDDKLPLISEMQSWINGAKYSIVLIKSSKEPYTFKFETKKEYKKVQLAGNFNNWSPENTSLEKDNGLWKTKLFLNPGKYQYQIVADGEWMLDPTNPEKIDNNVGGFNSVLEVKGKEWNKKPFLYTANREEEKIEIKTEGNATETFVLWQNQRLKTETEDDKIIAKIPKAAKELNRSFVRVYAYNTHGSSNDIFIPLEKGQIIEHADKLTRSDKRKTIMYFMMVDRFHNGNPDNDDPLDDPRVHYKANYHGGDLEGIYQKLNEGYFSDMGFNTIWISPITQNPRGAYKEYPAPRRWYSGYHGYWPVTLTTVDYRFGNSETLHNLVDHAHEKDMNVILDFVSNHVHKENKLYEEHPDWATNMILPSGDTNIRIWDEQRLTTWFDTFLPTLDLRKTEVRDVISDSALYWIKEYDLDGYRHDATKHIPQAYWQELTQKLWEEVPHNKSVLQIGETFGSRELIGDYVSTGKLDGQFDFNLYFDARNVFAKDDVSFKLLEQSLKETFSYYGWHSLMGNITGNHDIPRFISFAGGALKFDEDAKAAGWNREITVEDQTGYDKLSSLTAFIMTIPGIPVVYYGDEIGMAGAGDPDNRRDMRFENLSEKESLTKQTAKKLVNLRNNNIELLYGDFKFLETTDNTLVYARKYFDQVSLVIFNKAPESKTIQIKIPPYLEAEKLKANFNSEWNIEEGTLKLTLPPYSFDILNN